MLSNMDLTLKKFKMDWIKDDETVVLIGKRNTGKSFLTKDLLYHHQSIPIGTVISGTESANSFYSDIIPKLFIHDEYSEEILGKILKRQKKITKRLGDPDSGNLDPRAFLIMDDCLYDNGWQKSKFIREVFMNGRHWKLMFILTMQFALGVPPNLRTNIDWVFILRENFINNRKRLYEHYAGMFPTFEMFCKVMDDCTANYECLVIHNGSKSNKIEEQVYWYKAQPHEDFKIGSPKIWEYSEKNCVEEEEEYDETDINNYRFGKKKHPNLIVKKKL